MKFNDYFFERLALEKQIKNSHLVADMANQRKAIARLRELAASHPDFEARFMDQKSKSKHIGYKPYSLPPQIATKRPLAAAISTDPLPMPRVER